jgi:hypothetical protein
MDYERLLFIEKFIVGDFCFIDHFVGNIIIDRFTEKKGMPNKKNNDIILSVKMTYH